MCGIFGIWSLKQVSTELYFALMALQHRGQEAAGIATCGDGLSIYKNNGMVSSVFTQDKLDSLKGTIGIGHVRYSTSGGGVQPYIFKGRLGQFALAHNGQISNYRCLKQQLNLEIDNDTEILGHYIAQLEGDTWFDIFKQVVREIPGAYSLLILTEIELWALRDPLGIRLLSLGRKEDDWYISSETCAFNVLNVDIVKDIEAGSIICINKSGKYEWKVKEFEKATCAFEHVYFSRPDSVINDIYVSQTRANIGGELWREVGDRFNDGYVVAGVPDSATPTAIGFSHASNIPYTEIFSKNRYIHRTFIKRNNVERKSSVYLKFSPIRCNIEGKRIILIDDSIVRGNTILHLINIIKESGALEIHILIGSPTIHHPCYMGIDMKSKDELIMNEYSVDELCKKIDADSLHFLSLEGLERAIGEKGLCTACWTGKYPKELDW